MPGISTTTSFHLSGNFRFVNPEISWSVGHRMKTGSIYIPTPPTAKGTPTPTDVPKNAGPRPLDVDGLPQQIETVDSYWSGRESHVERWYRMAKADCFLLPFEIGNVIQQEYLEMQNMGLTNPKYWTVAVVGIITPGLDVSATAGVRAWAEERGAQYYEVSYDNGPTIDEMTVEIVRTCRRQSSKEKSKDFDKFFTEYQNKLYGRYNVKPKKNSKEWSKTESGWVAGGKTAMTASSSSSGCLVM